jgi:hypothetical protein
VDKVKVQVVALWVTKADKVAKVDKVDKETREVKVVRAEEVQDQTLALSVVQKA